MTLEDAWYSRLRERWRPAQVKLLLIAESAPDDGGFEERRKFFYSDRLGPDNLFRGVVEAMYGVTRYDLATNGKAPWLERLQSDGFFLVDLVPFPVNRLRGAQRTQVLREHAANCVSRAAALNPDGVIVVKKDVYPILAFPLQTAGLRLLHDTPLAFPLGNTRAEFVHGFNEARAKA